MTNTPVDTPPTCPFTSALAGRHFVCIRQLHDHVPDDHVMVKPYEAPLAGSAEPTLAQVDAVVHAFASTLVLEVSGGDVTVVCSACDGTVGYPERTRPFADTTQNAFTPELTTAMLDHVRTEHAGGDAAQALDGVPTPRVDLGPSV